MFKIKFVSGKPEENGPTLFGIRFRGPVAAEEAEKGVALADGLLFDGPLTCATKEQASQEWSAFYDALTRVDAAAVDALPAQHRSRILRDLATSQHVVDGATVEDADSEDDAAKELA